MEPGSSLPTPQDAQGAAVLANTQRPKAMELFKQSFDFLKNDKELALFPVMAAVMSVLAAIVVGLLWVAVFFGVLNRRGNTGVNYLFIFIYYVVSYYILIYYNSGLAACVLSNFKGGKATYKYGIGEAKKHRKAILGYAILAATVGLILRWVAERSRLLGRIIANLIGIAWSIATIFIAPVIVTSDLPPLQAVKESARIFKATWGNTLKGTIGFAFISLMGTVVALVPAFLSFLVGNAIIVVIGVLITIIAIVGWSIIVSTCSSIYRTALFHYATTKQVPSGFGGNLPLAVKASQK